MEQLEQTLAALQQPEADVLMGAMALCRASGASFYRDYALDKLRACARENRLDGLGMGMLFGLEATGEECFRHAVEQLAARPAQVERLADAYGELPFRMAYEMRLNRMAWVSRVVEQFTHLRKRLLDKETGLYRAAEGSGFSPAATGWYLAALVDCMEACDQQLYEHWRALVDIFREAMRGVLHAGSTSGAEALMVYAIRKGVRLGVLDPERYLPVAQGLAANISVENGLGAYMLAQAEEARELPWK